MPKNNGLFVSDTSWIDWCIFTNSGTSLFANILSSSSYTSGIYVTNDLGQNWTKLDDSVFTGAAINTITANKKYLFASAENGSWRIQLSGIVLVEPTSFTVPDEFSLLQNYPNPFNPTTKIKYSIPSNVNRETSNVSLKVYDVLGNEIATLVNEEKPAGEYEVEFNPLLSIKYPSSGVYFYQLKAGDFIEAKKMIYLK